MEGSSSMELDIHTPHENVMDDTISPQQDTLSTIAVGEVKRSERIANKPEIKYDQFKGSNSGKVNGRTKKDGLKSKKKKSTHIISSIAVSPKPVYQWDELKKILDEQVCRI